MQPPPDLASLSPAEKDALILRLLARVEVLMARVTALEAENAALRAKLDLPPKTPANSSTPPAHGHKANAPAPLGPGHRGKGKAHAGAHRPLHPNPTRRRAVMAAQCPHCRVDVSGVEQVAKASYDRIEIPPIQPDVTRVVLYGGICPCCARPFKASPPAGLEPGSPFGPNLRAFVLYLRAAHALSYERLARLMSELLGLEISEGALVNIMDDSRAAFARQREAIRARLLAEPILEADETSMRVRVGKQTWWNWVFHHADSACFVIAPSRGRAVVAQFLGAHRPDFWVSDRLAAQMGWATKEHQSLPRRRPGSLSPISSAMRNTPSMPAIPSSRRGSRSCCAKRAPSAADETASAMPRCAPRLSPGQALCGQTRSSPRCAASPRPHPSAGRKAPRRHQEVSAKPLRLRHPPGHPAHQQWLRAGAAALRHLPQSDQLLPRRLGG
jgi:hypothetical protein